MAFVCFANNYLQYIKSRRLAAEPDELRKYLQRIQHCQKPIESWALAAGGSVVAQDLAHSIYEVPVSALADVAKLQERFADETTLDCWVGVGRDMHEAVMAAEVAERKNLSRPLFSHEEYEDKEETKPSLNIAKSEPEELEKNVKNWLLRGAAAASILGSGTFLSNNFGGQPFQQQAPIPSHSAPASTVKAPEPQVDKSKPQKLATPKTVGNDTYDNTFWSKYDPRTLHRGTNDTLWAIGMGETSGGLQWDHKPAKSEINHPIDGSPMVRQDTAFGHFGMKPYTAFDAYVAGLGGVKKFKQKVEPEMQVSPMRRYDAPLKEQFDPFDYEEVFKNKFYRDPNFYNEVAKMHLNQIIDKHGKKDKGGILNPLYILNAWHYGKYAHNTPKRDEKGNKIYKDKEKKVVDTFDKIKQDPDDYRSLILGHLAREAKAGREFNFRDVFGNAGHSIMMQAIKEEIGKQNLAEKAKAKRKK